MTAKKMTLRAWTAWLKKYNQNEKSNYETFHGNSENVVLLAKLVGTKTQLQRALGIVRNHNKKGFLSESELQLRHELHSKLWPKLEKIKAAVYEKNPAPRIGTKRPLRASRATKKKPTKQLVARRLVNKKKGYFPNPLAANTMKYVVVQRSTKGDEHICYTTNNKYSMIIAEIFQKQAATGVTFFNLKLD